MRDKVTAGGEGLYDCLETVRRTRRAEWSRTKKEGTQ